MIRLGLIASLLLAPGCLPAHEASDRDEAHQLTVTLTGPCAAGLSGATLQLSEKGGEIAVGSPAPDRPVTVDVPAFGQLARDRTLRQGGWTLYGTTCLPARPCPDGYRACAATPVSWYLNLTCWDPTGAVACEGRLSE